MNLRFLQIGVFGLTLTVAMALPWDHLVPARFQGYLPVGPSYTGMVVVVTAEAAEAAPVCLEMMQVYPVEVIDIESNAVAYTLAVSPEVDLNPGMRFVVKAQNACPEDQNVVSVTLHALP